MLEDYLDACERDKLIRRGDHSHTMSTSSSAASSAHSHTANSASFSYQTTCAPVNNWATATQSGVGSWYGATAPSPSPFPKETFTIHGVELDLDEILKILKFKYTQEELEIMAMGLRLTRKED